MNFIVCLIREEHHNWNLVCRMKLTLLPPSSLASGGNPCLTRSYARGVLHTSWWISVPNSIGWPFGMMASLRLLIVTCQWWGKLSVGMHLSPQNSEIPSSGRLLDNFPWLLLERLLEVCQEKQIASDPLWLLFTQEKEKSSIRISSIALD